VAKNANAVNFEVLRAVIFAVWDVMIFIVIASLGLLSESFLNPSVFPAA
jgi:hypothetical protein